MTPANPPHPGLRESEGEKRDLSLTVEQRELARFLKKSYGFSWPFAAHISKDVLALQARATEGGCLASRDRSPASSALGWRPLTELPEDGDAVWGLLSDLTVTAAEWWGPVPEELWDSRGDGSGWAFEMYDLDKPSLDLIAWAPRTGDVAPLPAPPSSGEHATDCQSHIVDVRGVPDDCTCGLSGRTGSGAYTILPTSKANRP